MSTTLPALELVVARYREELNWLRKVPRAFRTTVYDKHDAPTPYPGAVPLPNVGREAHTYLHHLLTRYDTLADWTVFAQGKPFDHAFNFHHLLRAMAADPADTAPFGPWQANPAQFRWIGHIIDTDNATGHLFASWSKNDDGRALDLGGFAQTLFGQAPTTYPFVLGAQFAVHRSVVQARPAPFYERALALATTFPDAAHCFERTWNHVFGLAGIRADWLAGRPTVYLKPIRPKPDNPDLPTF